MRRAPAPAVHFPLAVAMLFAGFLLAAPTDFLAPAASAQTDPEARGAPDDTDARTRLAERRLERLRLRAERAGSVRVIVGLRSDAEPMADVPRSTLRSNAARESRRAAISRLQDRALRRLRRSGFSTKRRFREIPFVAVEVEADVLESLLASPEVTSVVEDKLHAPSLAQSIPQIGADIAHFDGHRGAGQAVAILDTGVDWDHPHFGGAAASRVVQEACFSANLTYGGGVTTAASTCPDETSQQIGTGSAPPCSLSNCDHGTHVAATAAGGGSNPGVAPDADIIAIQVFTRFDTTSACNPPGPANYCFCGSPGASCVLAFTSDIIAGLQHVLTLSATMDIAAANLSLGSGGHTTAVGCDGDNFSTKAAIDNLRAAGVATVISSGNDGFTDRIGEPACISSAVSVGAVDGNDEVASFSNVASWLKGHAPGTGVTAAVPGTSTATKSGTSMATPHVTGAWAVLKSKLPSATVDDIQAALTLSGVSVPGGGNGFGAPRIQVDAAADELNPGQPLPVDMILDNDYAGFEQPGSTFSIKNDAGSYAGRYLESAADGLTDAYRFEPNITQDGVYRIFRSRPASFSESIEARLEVWSDSGLEIIDMPPSLRRIQSVFFDDFEDGTLTPWSQLQLGQVSLVNDPADGWVMRKSVNGDPNGGWAPLGNSVTDYELIVFMRKVSTSGGGANRYSVTDADGDGYGFYFNFTDGRVTVERRDGWATTDLATSGGAIPGGLVLGQWYTMRMVRQGTALTGEVYVGRVDPLGLSPALSASATEGAHTSFDQVSVVGGADFDTDDVQVFEVEGGGAQWAEVGDFVMSAANPPYVEISDANGGSIAVDTIRLEFLSSEPIDVDSTSLADAFIGFPYTATLQASGGTPPYTWTLTGDPLPPGLVFDDATATISGAATAPATANIVVEASDVDQQISSRALTLSVVQNQPPAITSVSAASSAIGYWQTTQISVTASDPDGFPQPLTYAWSAPTGSFDNPVSPTPIYTPTVVSTQQVVTLTVQVLDGDLGTIGTVDITVNPNQGPGISSVTASPPAVIDWQTIQLSVTASDPDDFPQPAITFNWSAPAGSIGDPGSSTPIFTPPLVSAPTVITLAVEVSDGEFSATDSVDVTVNPNQGPDISSVTATPPSLLDTETSALSVSVVDPDGGPGPLTFNWSAPSGTFDNSSSPTPLYTPNPDTITGTQVVTVSVTVGDGRDFAVGTVDLTIDDETGSPPSSSLFFDDFEDGTLAPWSQLMLGQVQPVNDPVDGWVLRKSGNGDPNGGWAPLAGSVADYELVLHMRKVNTSGGGANRYAVTDGNGDGYGFYFNFTDSRVTVERRDWWASTKLATSGGSLPGGLALNQWYTMRLVREGTLLTGEVYVGRVDPSGLSPALSVTATDGAHGLFDQVSINGGAEFDTDDVRVSDLAAGPAPLAVETTSLPSATEGVFYDRALSATGGTPPYAWLVVGGALPAGLSLSSSGDLSGTPTALGTSNFTVEVTDGDGATVTQALSLAVLEPQADLFFDDFEDGTLAPWSQLMLGQVQPVNDPVDGWVLRKSGNGDPNGGWAPLAGSVSEFELVLYMRKVNTSGGGANRYAVTDGNGDGYGFYFNFTDSRVTVERRDGWASTKLATSGGSLSGGLALGQWYTMRLVRQGTSLTGEVYVGRVDPLGLSPALSVTATDGAHGLFDQVSINGGAEYDTDDVRLDEP